MSVQQRCTTVMPTRCVSTCRGYIAVTASQDTSVWMTSLVRVRNKVHGCFAKSSLLCTISVPSPLSSHAYSPAIHPSILCLPCFNIIFWEKNNDISNFVCITDSHSQYFWLCVRTYTNRLCVFKSKPQLPMVTLRDQEMGVLKIESVTLFSCHHDEMGIFWI
jgi:hypothetical protein